MFNMFDASISRNACGVDSLYEDGHQYDLQHADFDEDIDFYKKMAEEAERVLELACGTCRLGIPIGRGGSHYTGIDISQGMLAWACNKAQSLGLRIGLIRGDMRNFHLNEGYDLILLAFNSVCHLYTRQDFERCLGCVREHLEKEGRFVIDVFNPSLEILTRDPKERYPAGEYEDPYGKGKVIVTETNVYDRATQINWITWYYRLERSGEERKVRFGMRIYYPQELDALVNCCGFRIVAKYGDFDLRPFTSDSTKQIIVATAGA